MSYLRVLAVSSVQVAYIRRTGRPRLFLRNPLISPVDRLTMGVVGTEHANVWSSNRQKLGIIMIRMSITRTDSTTKIASIDHACVCRYSIAACPFFFSMECTSFTSICPQHYL